MRHAKLPGADEEYGTLFDALAGSLDHLQPELAKRCEMLATFPEDTDVPWSVVGQLWGTEELETQEALTELEEWHLIEVDWEARTLSLIDLHLDYLRARAKDDLARWHAALLRGCGRRVLGSYEHHEGRYQKTEDDAYWAESRNVFHHLAGGGPGVIASLSAIQGVGPVAILTVGQIRATVTAIGRGAIHPLTIGVAHLTGALAIRAGRSVALRLITLLRVTVLRAASRIQTRCRIPRSGSQ